MSYVFQTLDDVFIAQNRFDHLM